MRALATFLVASLIGAAMPAAAQPSVAAELSDAMGAGTGAVVVPQGVRRIADIAWGTEPRQRFDVYLPEHARGAPVLLMVHGGAWMFGNKAMPGVVNEKIAHWVRDRGFILVSTNYRLVPQVDPLTQAKDVALALAAVQASAASWGGNPDKVVLMGHSAGAHLVALLSAAPALATQQGAHPWLGSVVLDSAALDTSALMQRQHARFYDRVFGSEPAHWREVSPTDQLAAAVRPMLLVCSSQRVDRSCEQSEAFASRVQSVGGMARVLPQDLSHGQVNSQLGSPGAYTASVDAFIDPLIATH